MRFELIRLFELHGLLVPLAGLLRLSLLFGPVEVRQIEVVIVILCGGFLTRLLITRAAIPLIVAVALIALILVALVVVALVAIPLVAIALVVVALVVVALVIVV